MVGKMATFGPQFNEAHLFVTSFKATNRNMIRDIETGMGWHVITFCF